MKYLCMGYHNEKEWSALDAAQRDALIAESIEYANVLRNAGHVVDDRALKSVNEAVTLRFTSAGKVAVTDGPFAETKEQLGGFMILEATDLNHAIQIMTQMPCMRAGGSMEIRPIAEVADLVGANR